MASISNSIEYPTSDGKPIAETDVHRDLMFDLIFELANYYAGDPIVYISGNLLVFYEPGDKYRHVSPDVFVVQGVAKHRRLNYLICEEGKGPDFVIEVTSKPTRHEDQRTKFQLYRDVLRVPEYFLFDPFGEYLKVPLQGHHLIDGNYVPIEPEAGRLPSLTTGLHLERHGDQLRLFNPITDTWLPTPVEKTASAVARAREAEIRARNAEVRSMEESNRRREVELDRLRRELAALRRGQG